MGEFVARLKIEHLQQKLGEETDERKLLYRGTVLRQSTATLRGHFVLHGDRGFKPKLFGSDLVWCFVAVPLA